VVDPAPRLGIKIGADPLDDGNGRRIDQPCCIDDEAEEDAALNALLSSLSGIIQPRPAAGYGLLVDLSGIVDGRVVAPGARA
jgi:hypothetical protein